LRYEITQGKDTFRVEVRGAGGNAFDVSIDGGPSVRVDACKTARTVYSVLIGSRQYEASVDARENGILDVHIGTSAFDFTAIDERRKALLGAAGYPAKGKQELRAQMSGKIVKILVDVGQQVDIDQDLVVIESMKMENEVRSPIRGVVTKVAIEEGVAVETGALLIVIEPTGTR
jgi:biotin carboxyl carrier protein